MDLAPGKSQNEDESSTRDTLNWAHRIRARMTGLVNSQQPVSRLSSGLIAEIIMIESACLDRGQDDRILWRGDRPRGYRPDPLARGRCFSASMIRCGQLRTVCKAWRDAIDSTPNFNRYIVMNGWRNNIQYVQRYNNNSPLECFLELQPSNRLGQGGFPSLSEPLTQRLYSLNIYMSRVIIEPASFPTLRVLRIFGDTLHWGWAVDPLRMAHANPGLRELVVDFPYLSSGYKGRCWPSPPPLRVEHAGLQRVQLTGTWPSPKSDVLDHLELKGCVQLLVDEIELGCLRDSHSALRKMIRSLGQTGVSGIIGGRLEMTTSWDWADKGYTNSVRFLWCEVGQVPPPTISVR